MKAAFVFMLLGLASGLKVQGEPPVDIEPENPNYAYITMWIDKPTTPERVFKRVLTKDETVALNSGAFKGGSWLQKEEGKPALKETQEMPLRPRNNNYHGILDLAKNLRDVGAKYPLAVITNSEELRNETVLKENPNLQLVWLNDTDFLNRNCKIGAGHELHFQKLMIWKLTQYDKLIWFDTDVAFAKNIDYVFKMDTRNGTRIYGQVDDYHCDGRNFSPTSGGVCSAMLLLKPDLRHFKGLMMQQNKMQACWGDQSIIMGYFNGGQHGKTQAMQFKRSTINFHRCREQGSMDVVHFSGSPDAKRVGDPEGFTRTKSGQLVDKSQLAAQKKKH